MSKVKEEENTYNFKLARIRKEVEENYYRLDTAKKNIMTTYQAKESAQESLRLSKLRFKAGISKNREVINQKRDKKMRLREHLVCFSLVFMMCVHALKDKLIIIKKNTNVFLSNHHSSILYSLK